MSAKLLQVNYKFAGTRAEYEAANLPAAPQIAGFPGLRWKIWLMNEAGQEGGGIVLFDDEAARQAYINLVQSVVQNEPGLSDLSIKSFDVLEAHTAITRGPIEHGVPA
ncbi:MAG: YdhR family protein [Anaerolineales bacterium]|nr:YdhR family protein [Anaerolineales bacterium]